MGFSNVFVLCTGRCGSTTFARACEHITNFSAGHETRTRETGDARLAYPANHIEADNRLSWFLGRLDAAYGKHSYYVHLWRDPEAVARSLLAQPHQKHGIVPAYHQGIVRGADVTPHQAALDYIRTVTENITLFLRDKPHHLSIDIDTAASTFPAFWQAIGATGNLGAALAEFSVRHNKTKPSAPTTPRLLRRLGGRIRRAIRP